MCPPGYPVIITMALWQLMHLGKLVNHLWPLIYLSIYLSIYTYKLEQLYKIGSEWELNSWPESLVRASERGLAVVGSNLTQANFL